MLIQRMFLTPAGCLEVDGQGRWKHALAESVVPMSLSGVEPGLWWSAEGSGLSLTPWSPGGPGVGGQLVLQPEPGEQLWATETCLKSKVFKADISMGRLLSYDPSWYRVRNLGRISRWQFCGETWHEA